MPIGRLKEANYAGQGKGKAVISGYVNAEEPNAYPMTLPLEGVTVTGPLPRVGDRVEYTLSATSKKVTSLKKL